MIRAAKVFMLASAVIWLVACSRSGHLLPQVDARALEDAQSELKQAELPDRQEIGNEEAAERVRQVAEKLRPAAMEICRHAAEGGCTWTVQYSPKAEVNAYASGYGMITIHRGIIEYAENDDELAMVISHEIAHHISDHITEGQNDAIAGAVVGAIVVGVAVAILTDGRGVGEAANIGALAGGAAGALIFSKDQEREADYLSVYILERAGYDPEKGRGLLVKLGLLSGRETTSPWDSHPAGPERLAAWDKARSEIKENPEGMPVPALF